MSVRWWILVPDGLCLRQAALVSKTEVASTLLKSLVGISVALLMGAPGATLSAQTTDLLRESYEQTRTANRIDAEGQAPFHIKIGAQLYGLDGKPAQTATVEEWWAAGRSHIEIEGPDGKEIETGSSDAAAPPVKRSSYLLHKLLEQNVDPLPPLGENATIRADHRELEHHTFNCLSVKQSVNKFASDQVFCEQDGTHEIRVSIQGTTGSSVRNQIAKFNGSSIALKTEISLSGKPAISGEIEALQKIDPQTSQFPELRNPVTRTDLNDADSQPNLGVVAGHKLTGSNPDYPPAAKYERISGAVLLAAVISRTGQIASLDVVSSPSPTLSAAALRAVRTWTYKPFLLNGKPAEVNTTITVNFSIH